MLDVIEGSWEHVTLERIRRDTQEARDLALREGREEGLEDGRQEGRDEGRLITGRELLRLLLEKRFGELPDDLVARIENVTDADRLEACIVSVLDVQSPDEIDLG